LPVPPPSGHNAEVVAEAGRRGGRPDQILGARVTLTAWAEGSEPELARALEEAASPASLDGSLPLVVLERTSRANAERVRDLLVDAGGTVSVDEVWMTREESGGVRPRPACPACGSIRTQPYTYAGPGSRMNMKCTACGHLFRDQAPRS
jgi:hypothetical protein